MSEFGIEVRSKYIKIMEIEQYQIKNLPVTNSKKVLVEEEFLQALLRKINNNIGIAEVMGVSKTFTIEALLEIQEHVEFILEKSKESK